MVIFNPIESPAAEEISEKDLTLYSSYGLYRSVAIQPQPQTSLAIAKIPLTAKEAYAKNSPHQIFAQVPPVLRDVKPPSLQPPPEPKPLPPLPPPDQLLPSQPEAPTQPEIIPGQEATTILVKGFEFEGNTVFSDRQLAEVTKPFIKETPISFAELQKARSAITKLYVDHGYITSGAILPAQSVKDGIVKIQVVEGTLEKINVTGTRRLQSGYIRQRLKLAATKPLNRERLLEGLQLLQRDPLIQTLSADLQAGTRPGTNILEIKVTEADTFSTQFVADNGRSPSVGSFRRQVFLNEANLLGYGDAFRIGYTNTDGSNGFDLSYLIPLNARNGKLFLAYGYTDSNIIEEPSNVLDITANSQYYELSFRQPIIETPTQEFALGLTFSRQSSQTFLGLDDIGAYPLSPGADNQGRTRVSALRFSQEWTKRSSREVYSARSQFSFGLGVLDATINENEPDSRFFSWRGQGQWVRLLASDALLLLRTDVQLAANSLLPLEQIGLGGISTVRGYRQDALLTDNGLLASAEIRLPILRVPKARGLLQLTPFVDFGIGWNNNGNNLDRNSLVGVGAGLLWQQGGNLTARFDWGIPLISVESTDKRTWQENGLYFSIVYTPF
uniref:ShlB/FhaC/HecB family hemolysin secretion/activation protein n=2 Tax=Desmonostoc muscorum TaxID=1179 RepID=A0A8J7AKH0_DESMC